MRYNQIRTPNGCQNDENSEYNIQKNRIKMMNHTLRMKYKKDRLSELWIRMEQKIIMEKERIHLKKRLVEEEFNRNQGENYINDFLKKFKIDNNM